MSLRLFLSSVTARAASDDGKPDQLRTWLDGELKKSSTHCVYQEFFIELGVNTLVKLAEAIRSECEIVVHIVGNEIGCQPPAGFVEELLKHCGEEAFRETFRAVFERDNAVDRELLYQLTYTQWEAWLGHFYRKTVLMFSANTIVVQERQSDSAERLALSNNIHIQMIERYLGRPRQFTTQVDLLDSIKNALLRMFQSQLVQANKLPWPDTCEPLSYFLADRHEELQLFLDIVSPKCRERILLIHGPSNRGKTALISEFQRQVSAIPSIKCGKADFKGGMSLKQVLSKLVCDVLYDGVPKTSEEEMVDPSISTTFLRFLGRSRNAVLLLLDTYEEATKESRLWIETFLLPSVRRMDGVAIVIGGHFVPSPPNRLQEIAIVHELRPINDGDFWIAYRDAIGLHTVSDVHIRELVATAAGNPGIIGPLLKIQKEATNNGF